VIRLKETYIGGNNLRRLLSAVEADFVWAGHLVGYARVHELGADDGVATGVEVVLWQNDVSLCEEIGLRPS
jgi:hypothetical protein